MADATIDETKVNRPLVSAEVVPINIHAAQFRTDGAFINLILVKREGEDGWSLPGGFIRSDESLETCAARSLLEATGISAKMLIPSSIFSLPERDPRSQVISASFIVILPSGDFAPLKVAKGDGIAEVGLFNLAKSYVDKQTQKVHVNALCVENGAHIEFDATFGREMLGAIRTNISYGVSTNVRLVRDHADIIARALWQRNMLFEDTSKYVSPTVHVTPTAEQDIKKEVAEGHTD